MLVVHTVADKKVVCRDGTYDYKISHDVIERECYKGIRLRHNDVVLDAGANIGAFTLWAHDKCKHVVAVEPEPNNMTLLLDNCRSNGVENYTPLLGAIVGNDDKFRPIYVNLGGNKAIHRLIPTRGRHIANVDCFNIYKLITEYDISVMKIDIEGSEIEVLTAIKSKHWKRIQAIVLEYHFQALKDFNHKKYRGLCAMLYQYFPCMRYNEEINKRWKGMIYGWKEKRYDKTGKEKR